MTSGQSSPGAPDSARSTVFVKICGITRERDALAAIDAGADALGFNFFPGSKRALDPTVAPAWIRRLPTGVERIAVVVNPSSELLATLANSAAFDGIQFHGDESPQDCARCPLPWLKAIPAAQSAPQNLRKFSCTRILIDAVAAAGEYGGTGQTADWDLARACVVSNPDRVIWLAGGLTPDNVASAIRATRVAGVDVAGGVESSPGIKDPAKLRAFIAAVRSR